MIAYNIKGLKEEVMPKTLAEAFTEKVGIDLQLYYRNVHIGQISDKTYNKIRSVYPKVVDKFKVVE